MTEHTQTPSLARRISPDTQSLSRREGVLGKIQGWLWAGLVVVGLIGVVGTSQWFQTERLSVGRTATVIANAQTALQRLTLQADGVERGESGALNQMQDARSLLTSALTTLNQGGFAEPGDPVPVLRLQGRKDIPLAQVEENARKFEQASQPLIENARLLEQAHAAENTFGPTLAKVSQSVKALQSSPAFSQGTWQEAISGVVQEWTRPELQTMAVVFSPVQGGGDLQKQWANRFKSQSEQLARLNTVASRSNQIPVSDRQRLNILAQQTKIIADNASILASVSPIRLQVQQTRDQWRQPLTDAQKALDQASATVFSMAKGRGFGDYVVWMFAAIGLLGVILLVREWFLGNRLADAASQDSIFSLQGQEQIDHITRQLRRIIPGDGPIQRGTKLHEDPDSPVFPLVAMINRLIDTFDMLEDDIKNRAAEMDLSLAEGLEAGGSLSNQIQRHHQFLDRTEKSLMDLARKSANLAKRTSDLQDHLRQGGEGVKDTILALQQSTFKGDAIREATQESAKRVKRLSESAQAISLSVDLIYEVIQQVQVLSTNVAIEAANSDQGKNFIVIAKEIQRLVTNGTTAAQEIDKVVEEILSDTKDTVVSMEDSTTEVVESSRLTGRAMTMLREAEKQLGQILNDFPQLARDIEKQAVTGNDAAEQVQATIGLMAQTTKDAERTQEVFATSRGKAHQMIKFIDNGQSRTIWRRNGR